MLFFKEISTKRNFFHHKMVKIKNKNNSKSTHYWLFLLICSQLEPFLYCLDLMDKIFHPAKNKSWKFILLKHACSTRFKSSMLVKLSVTTKVLFVPTMLLLVKMSVKISQSTPTVSSHGCLCWVRMTNLFLFSLRALGSQNKYKFAPFFRRRLCWLRFNLHQCKLNL